jgi:hypothetical protein
MAFPFKSSQFGDAEGVTRQKLNDCATKDTAHFVRGSFGDHIGLVQDALIQLNQDAFLDPKDVPVFQAEAAGAFYGPMTAKVVESYKNNHKPRPILQPWQKTADNVVGKQTIFFLDDDMAALEGNPPSPDPKPKPPADTFIFFSGVQDGPSAGAPLDDTAIGHGFLMRPRMKTKAEERPNGKFLAIGGGLRRDQEEAGIGLALKFLLDNRSTPPGKHIVYGFSAGGTNALNLALRIDEFNKNRPKDAAKLRIDRLVTVDASTRNDSTVKKTTVVGGCVRRCANFFQQEIRPQLDGVGGSFLTRGKDSDGESPTISPNRRLDDRALDSPIPGTAHRKIEEVTISESLAQFNAELALT